MPIRQLSTSSLAVPQMLAKIRLGMRLAALGKGEQMNGRANRVYVSNRYGRNLMRIDWDTCTKSFVFYGNDFVRIDSTIKQAFAQSNLNKV